MRPSTASPTPRRLRPARAVAVAVSAIALLVAAACEPDPDPATESTTTTTDGGSGTSSTTTTASTTTTESPTTTEAPTTTTTLPDGGTSLTLTDTGFTRVRVDLTSQASWVELHLVGAHFSLTREVSTSGSLDIVSLGGDEITATGTGTAVVDLVLDLRSGASPVLTMCKNYMGPATVELSRLTDGDTVVASMVNDGSSTAVSQDGCENARSQTVSRADLIGPVRWPARRDPRPLVLAGYYPWYDDETLGQIAGPDLPTGPADTSDPSEVQVAVDLARSSGIDGFLVEWEGSSRYEPRIESVFDAADARPGFQMALTIDFAVLAYHPEGLQPSVLDQALAAVASHSDRASQLEVGGRPVVFLYSAERVDPAQWSAALDRLRESTGLRPFVVADDPALGSPGRYDYSTNDFQTDDELSRWTADRLLKMQLAQGLRGEVGPLWVAPVSPGYDDRALGRPQPRYVPRDGGARYERTWNAALASLPDWILVTSWNEYYEQTHVAPGTTTGTLALDQTATRSRTFHTTG